MGYWSNEAVKARKEARKKSRASRGQLKKDYWAADLKDRQSVYDANQKKRDLINNTRKSEVGTINNKAQGGQTGWIDLVKRDELVSQGYSTEAANYLLGKQVNDDKAGRDWLSEHGYDPLPGKGELRGQSLYNIKNMDNPSAVDAPDVTGTPSAGITGVDDYNVDNAAQLAALKAQFASYGLNPDGTPISDTSQQNSLMAPKLVNYDLNGNPTNLANNMLGQIKQQGIQAQRNIQGNLAARGVGTSGAALRGRQAIATQTGKNLLTGQQGMKTNDQGAIQKYQTSVGNALTNLAARGKTPANDEGDA